MLLYRSLRAVNLTILLKVGRPIALNVRLGNLRATRLRHRIVATVCFVVSQALPFRPLRGRYLFDVRGLDGDVLLGEVAAGGVGLLLLLVAADDVLQVGVGVGHPVLEERLAVVDRVVHLGLLRVGAAIAAARRRAHP